MVIPVGPPLGQQHLTVVERGADGRVKTRQLFVPRTAAVSCSPSRDSARLGEDLWIAPEPVARVRCSSEQLTAPAQPSAADGPPRSNYEVADLVRQTHAVRIMSLIGVA